MEEKTTKEQILKEKISKHDISFEYSDDHRCWKNGVKELDEIKILCKGLNPKLIQQIWNDVVRSQFKGTDFLISLEKATEWSKQWKNHTSYLE